MTTRDGAATSGKHTTHAKTKNVTVGPEDVLHHVEPHVQAILERATTNVSDDHRTALTHVCLKAASEQTTLTDACRDKTRGPSRRTLQRKAANLQLDDLETAINDELWTQGIHRITRDPLIAIDLTLLPYHGQPQEDPEELKRGRAKQGTTWFHGFATLYLCEHHKRHTLLVCYLRNGDTPTDALTTLVDEAMERGLSPGLVLVDKGFCTVDAIRLLRGHELPFITPLPLNGKRAKGLCRGRSSRWDTYQIGGKQGEDVRVAVVVKRNDGTYHGKKPGLQYFPYVADGLDGKTPHQVFKLYSRRPGVEASYRLMNRARARTSSRSPALRLFYVALSFLLQNAWVLLGWATSHPRRGRTGRVNPKGHFPFKQLLRFVQHWFWGRYGVVMEVERLPNAERGS